MNVIIAQALGDRLEIFMDQFDLRWDLCDKLTSEKQKPRRPGRGFQATKYVTSIRCNKIDFRVIVAQ